MIAATWKFGVIATVIMPKKVKYSNVKYMKHMYRKNLAAFHSNVIIEYTMML